MSETNSMPTQVRTTETPTTKIKTRYSDEELGEFKRIISARLKKEKKELVLLKSHCHNKNGTGDSSPGHQSFNECQENLSKEENATLIVRAEKHIRDLRNSLLRIENRTYGVCRLTGKLIPKQRLLLVPHATLTMEGKVIEEEKKKNNHHRRFL